MSNSSPVPLNPAPEISEAPSLWEHTFTVTYPHRGTCMYIQLEIMLKVKKDKIFGNEVSQYPECRNKFLNPKM